LNHALGVPLEPLAALGPLAGHHHADVARALLVEREDVDGPVLEPVGDADDELVRVEDSHLAPQGLMLTSFPTMRRSPPACTTASALAATPTLLPVIPTSLEPSATTISEEI